MDFNLTSLIIYMVFCNLWAIFATRMQHKLRGNHKLVRVFILNYLACPIAMIIAIILCPIEDRDESKGFWLNVWEKLKMIPNYLYKLVFTAAFMCFIVSGTEMCYAGQSCISCHEYPVNKHTSNNTCDNCHFRPALENYSLNYKIPSNGNYRATNSRQVSSVSFEEIANLNDLKQHVLYKVCVDNREYLVAAGKVEYSIVQVFNHDDGYKYANHVACK